MSAPTHGDGRVALVTGAAGGLGRGIAVRLLRDGFRVVLADTEEAESATLPAGRALAVRCDVSNPRDVSGCFADLMDAFGRLDVLVNNAGIGGPSTTVADTDVAEFQRVFDVNVIGTFLMSRQAIPLLTGSGRGRIVNLASLFGQQPVAGAAAYCSSKAAVAALTQTLALELAATGVTVNAIAPGYMMTRMHSEEIALRAKEAGISVDEQERRFRREVPLGRHGTGDDVAGAVAWLVSDDAAYVTGQTISVNGGLYLT